MTKNKIIAFCLLFLLITGPFTKQASLQAAPGDYPESFDAPAPVYGTESGFISGTAIGFGIVALAAAVAIIIIVGNDPSSAGGHAH